MMSSVWGPACWAAAPIRNAAYWLSARSTTAAAPSPNKAEEITSALALRAERNASVHNYEDIFAGRRTRFEAWR